MTRKEAVAGMAGCLVVVGSFLAMGRSEPVLPRASIDVPVARADCRTFLPEGVEEIRPGAPDEETHASARVRMAAGERLYADRDLEARSLYDAIVAWAGAAALLGGWEERPGEYYDALGKVLEAEVELCDRYREARRAVDLAGAGGRLDDMLYFATWIVSSIPDPLDPRYQWAKSVQLDVRREIRDRDASSSLYGG